MPKSTKTKTNRTVTGQNPDKATPEKAEQKHDQPDMIRTQMSGTRPAPAELPLNREKREQLIQWWRSQGWTYEQITAKFEAGVTEAEYEEYKKQWEA
jgi:hypothetical protein